MDNKSQQEQDKTNANIGLFAMISVVILSALILYFLIQSPAPLTVSADTTPLINTTTQGSSPPLS
jgi:hypothetical protein